MAPFLEPADKIAKSLRHNDGLSLLLDFGTAAVSLRRLFRIQNVFEKLGVSNKIELLSRLEIWENG